MRSISLALLAVFLFSNCSGAKQSSPENPYKRHFAMILALFDAFERGDEEAVKSLLPPEIRDTEFEKFKNSLQDVLSPDRPLRYRFTLQEARIYKDSHGGSPDIMADVDICMAATVFSPYFEGEHRRIFHLFYHFHFDQNEELFLYFNRPVSQESPLCAS